jgi:hypothetical protein
MQEISEGLEKTGLRRKHRIQDTRQVSKTLWIEHNP